jgi:hypothetical protein
MQRDVTTPVLEACASAKVNNSSFVCHLLSTNPTWDQSPMDAEVLCSAYAYRCQKLSIQDYRITLHDGRTGRSEGCVQKWPSCACRI